MSYSEPSPEDYLKANAYSLRRDCFFLIDFILDSNRSLFKALSEIEVKTDEEDKERKRFLEEWKPLLEEGENYANKLRTRRI